MGYGGGNYHLGSGEALDGVTYQQVREGSGSDGDGEDDSPPTQHRLALGMHPNMLDGGGTSSRLHHHHHPPPPPPPGGGHLVGTGGNSLRRSRSRPSPIVYQSPGLVLPPGVGLQQQENPYQQPYLSRSGIGLSDSPTSENGSDASDDSELPYANTSQQLPYPLQNGTCPSLHVQ